MTGLLDRVGASMDRAGIAQGGLAHAESGMHLLRYDAPSPQQATVYRPLLCLVLQGAKQVSAGAHRLNVGAGQSLIVSHALPVVSRIIEAAPDSPYVALVLPLDLDLLRGLAPTLPPARVPRGHDPFSITLCQTDPAMQDALARYLDQCAVAQTRQMLAPITLREIHARLLLGPHADALQNCSGTRPPPAAFSRRRGKFSPTWRARWSSESSPIGSA